jgi:uncharacterized protein
LELENDRVESISLPLNGTDTLSGSFCPGTTATDFAVVWVHGFGSFRGGEKAAALRAECLHRGWAFAAFDFRGHGRSSGSMLDLCAARLLEDLAAIRGFLGSQGHTRIGFVGSSMGAFASAWFTLRHPEAVAGCVFVAPGFSFLERRWNNLTAAGREAWKRTGKLHVTNDWVDTEIGYCLPADREMYRPRILAAGWRTPALLFHGLADEVVPETDSLNFIREAAYPGIELRLLKDGDHRLTAYKDEIAAEIGRFFARLLPRPE